MSALLAQPGGTLAATPFSALLVSALDARSTGTLVLEEPGGLRHGVYFDAGSPSKAKTRSAGLHLGEVLVEYGKLSAELHEDTLERALRERVLHGDLLVSEGLISEETRELGLREQLARQVLWLFERPEHTKYGYFDGQNLLAHWGGAPLVRLDPHELLWRSLHDHPSAFDVDGSLARLAGRNLQLRAEAYGADFEFMGWESVTVRRLRERPQRMSELFSGRPGEEASIRRVLCFLVLTRSLELGQSSAPPGPDAERPSSIPPIAVRSASFREELRQRLARLDGSHYEVLGVSASASREQVGAAFVRLARRWHPERLAPAAASYRDAAARIFERLAEASRVLSDPVLRRQYDASLERAVAVRLRGADTPSTLLPPAPEPGSAWSRLLKRRS